MSLVHLQESGYPWAECGAEGPEVLLVVDGPTNCIACMNRTWIQPTDRASRVMEHLAQSLSRYVQPQAEPGYITFTSSSSTPKLEIDKDNYTSNNSIVIKPT